MLNTLHKNLEPGELVVAALASTVVELAASWGEMVLLVQLDDPKGPLATSLRNGQANASAARTVGAPQSSTLGRRGTSLRPHATWPESLIAQQLKTRLVRTVHFAAPIEKRPGRPLMRGERFAIGRSLESDLLLLTTAVSKMHAWLRRVEGAGFEVADNGSRNGTTLNGTVIPAQRPLALAPGDILGFGDIEVMLCPTAAVWTVVRGG